MRLFILGNGFDSAHNLKTTYLDFRSFLKNVDYNFLSEFERIYGLYSDQTGSDVLENLLWSEFESNLPKLDEFDYISNAENINLNLESEDDSGVYDTLKSVFEKQFDVIEGLLYYLKKWVASIEINKISPKTTLINKKKNDLFLTFNYTNSLERIYEIPSNRVIHIHGSLNKRGTRLVLGHGDTACIQRMKEVEQEAQNNLDEKKGSMAHALKNYYRDTYKNTQQYLGVLDTIFHENIKEIYVVGHSLAKVDQPYFKKIDDSFDKKLVWKVVYTDDEDLKKKSVRLDEIGIEKDRREMIGTTQFFDI